MKRIICLFLVLIFCLCPLFSCGRDEGTVITSAIRIAQQLSTPVLKLEDGEVTWEKVENATKYEVVTDGNNSVFVDADTTTYAMGTAYIIKVRAIGDGDMYLDSEWSNAVFQFPDDEF